MSNPIHEKGESNVSFTGKNGTACPGFLARAEGSAMGVIVIQEWWGMNAQIVDDTRLFAAQGFNALTVDLYRGEVAVDHEHAGHLMGGLDWPGAVDDLKGAAEYLRSEVGCTHVGVVGFCMGGALTIACAARVGPPLFSAAAPFYGIPGADFADPSTIKIPIQCHFGDEDNIAGFSDPEAAAKLEEKLKAGGVVHEFHRYPAPHAFTNRSSDNYREGAAKDALERTYSFFKQHLQ